MKYNAWSLEFRPGGWIRSRDATGTTVFFQMRFVGEAEMSRAQVHVALMDSREPISARSWRAAPFQGAEYQALLPEALEILKQPPEVHVPEALDEYFDRTAGDYQVSGVVPGQNLVADEGEPPADFEPITPPGARITDEFLENIAAMYRWAVAAGKAPAPTIAESAGVPTSRVHRWVALARQRGLMPPGIRGRVG